MFKKNKEIQLLKVKIKNIFQIQNNFLDLSKIFFIRN
jgi:hypothetical protein